MSEYPSGTVTFLFTDIEGSTKLSQEFPEEMPALLARHNEILENAIKGQNGFIFNIVGDSYHAAFHNAERGLNAALEAQRSLNNEVWSPAPIKVRMGLHTGNVTLENPGSSSPYTGYATLALTSRVMSAGHGGQILLSQDSVNLLDTLTQIELKDMGEHNLKDVQRPQRMYQVVASDLPTEFPPLKTLKVTNHNLPLNLTSFVGREKEISEIEVSLEESRLLTLIGPGGTGKTRLSIQLGSQLLSSFKDGVWLAELAPIADPSLVMQTIAAALGIQEVPGVPIQTLVLDFLREKQLLLIFDNCEHLVGASAKAADEFLHTAPKIKIIASSREALGINGETVYRVPSLSLPNQAQVTKEAALGCESVQLFVDRASAANPKFQLTDENASAVAQICSRLDGIPLAIELSASRITVFSPEQIAKRLDDRFKLLTGGSRTALPRQQTLRALIDWSYDLLSEDERALLRRLSVFAGGWTFEAAETICNNVDVFEYLPHLINKSLVVVKDEGEEPRYYLLETIRQYARDKLLEAGEGEGTRDRHLAYYLALAETAEDHLLRSTAGKWTDQLELELDNLRTALEWGMSNDPESSLRIAGALVYFWLTRSHDLEGLRWLTEAMAHSKPAPDQQISNLAKAWSAIALLNFSQGQNGESQKAGKEAVRLWRQIDDKRYLAIALAYYAVSNVYLGNEAEALSAMEEVMLFVREVNDKPFMAVALGMIVQIIAMIQGDFETARAYGEEAIAIMREHGNPWYVRILLFWVGIMEVQQGNFNEARSKLKSAQTYMREAGDRHRINMVDSELAHIERYEGHYREAGVLYKGTLKEWQRIGHRAAVAHQLECMAFIARASEQTEKSAQLLGAAEALREKIGAAMTPPEREAYDKEVADLKANMDEKEFASLWAEGRSMGMEQAIEIALKE